MNTIDTAEFRTLFKDAEPNGPGDGWERFVAYIDYDRKALEETLQVRQATVGRLYMLVGELRIKLVCAREAALEEAARLWDTDMKDPTWISNAIRALKDRRELVDASVEIATGKEWLKYSATPTPPVAPEGEGKAWRNLQATVQMVCNMLERDERPVRKEAAKELRKAMDQASPPAAVVAALDSETLWAIYGALRDAGKVALSHKVGAELGRLQEASAASTPSDGTETDMGCAAPVTAMASSRCRSCTRAGTPSPPRNALTAAEKGRLRMNPANPPRTNNMNTYYNNGPEGMQRIERMTDSTLNSIIRHSLFASLDSFSGEDRDRLYGLMHDTAEEVLARLPEWPPSSPVVPVGQEDARDAARYRWLRDPNTDVALVLDKKTGYVPIDERVPGVGGCHTYEYRAGEELDAAIDAAMSTARASEPVTAESVRAELAAMPADERQSLIQGTATATVDAKADTTPKAASVDAYLDELLTDLQGADGDYSRTLRRQIKTHITALVEAARQEGHATGRRNGARDEAAAQAESIEELNAIIERLRAAQAGSELAGMDAEYANFYKHLRDGVIAAQNGNGYPADGSVWVVKYVHKPGTMPSLESAGYGAVLDANIKLAVTLAKAGEGSK